MGLITNLNLKILWNTLKHILLQWNTLEHIGMQWNTMKHIGTQWNIFYVFQVNNPLVFKYIFMFFFFFKFNQLTLKRTIIYILIGLEKL